MLPDFHVLSTPAMPVVEMEAERIMLGSNNYLGLTGDERVMHGAEDALHRYRTGLTRSRLLNGTIPCTWSSSGRSAGVDRHRGRACVHHRPSGRHRTRWHDPRAQRTVIVADSAITLDF